MAWPIDISAGPFANTTLVGVAGEFVPHVILQRLPDGNLKAYGLAASIICNATWAMGIKLKVIGTSDNNYGAMTPDGRYLGALLDLAEHRADFSIAPMARFHPYDDYFGKSINLEGVRVIMIAGMKEVYRKSSTSIINEELLTEVFPLLIAVAVVSIVLSAVFNDMIIGGGSKYYANLFFMFYYPTLFNETSHAQMVSNSRITYSSKILFGGWLLAIFVITVFIQSTLKSSFVMLVETERIRSNKDVLDRPQMLPIMHKDLSLFLSAVKMENGDEVLAKWERLKPESEVALKDYYSVETVEKVVSRRGVIYADEFGSIYELPRLCPKIRGSYIYQSSGLSEVQSTFYYRPGLNSTLAREIDKRNRWLLEANIPWIPRYIMDPTNSPCFVKSHGGEALGGAEATHLSAEDLFGVWVVLCVGALFSSAIFIAEIIFSSKLLHRIIPCGIPTTGSNSSKRNSS